MKVHRPCLVLCIALIVGILLGLKFSIPFILLLILGIVLIIFHQWISLFIIIGMILMNAHIVRTPELSGKVKGVISSDIEQTQLLGKIHQAFLWQYQYGKARVHYAGSQILNYGDEIILEGNWFRRPIKFQRFDDNHRIFWQIYVKANQLEIIKCNKGNVIKAFALNAKHRLRDSLVHFIDPDFQGTLIAMLFGDRNEMEKEFQDIFRRTGASHILAISGMNMTIITLILLTMLKFTLLPRRFQYAIVIVVLWAYAVATGLSASVTRASLMATIMLIGKIIDEEGDLLNTLGLSAFILLLIDPGNLFDIGFQLSFAAVFGLIVWAKPIESFLKVFPLWIARSLSVSIAASAATAPFLMYHFGSFTPIGVLSNILIVPLADMIVGLAFLTSIISLMMPWIAYVLAACLNTLFATLFWIVYLFSLIPGGYWQI